MLGHHLEDHRARWGDSQAAVLKPGNLAHHHIQGALRVGSQLPTSGFILLASPVSPTFLSKSPALPLIPTFVAGTLLSILEASGMFLSLLAFLEPGWPLRTCSLHPLQIKPVFLLASPIYSPQNQGVGWRLSCSSQLLPPSVKYHPFEEHVRGHKPLSLVAVTLQPPGQSSLITEGFGSG